MCRLVSAVWWMVPPAPPISLLSSRPSRRALPQIVAHIAHVHTYAKRWHTRDNLRRERGAFRRGRIIEPSWRCLHNRRLFFSPISSLREVWFPPETFNGTLWLPLVSQKRKPSLDIAPCSHLPTSASGGPARFVINNKSTMSNDIASCRLLSPVSFLRQIRDDSGEGMEGRWGEK